MTSPGKRWGKFPVTVAGAVTSLHYMVHGRPSKTFGLSVHRGVETRRSVALTFDDGPSRATPELLKYLAAEGIRATFFQCGMNVERHPEIARQVRDAGHEIGNHTYSHARLCPQISRKPNLRSPGNIFRELARTQEVLKRVVGVTPTLFRPPYGLRWWGLGKAQRRLGLLGVLWTVIAHDWEWPAERIAERLLANTSPGGILCLHDGRDIREEVDLSEMLEALHILVPTLRAAGYRFETVSQILTLDLQETP